MPGDQFGAELTLDIMEMGQLTRVQREVKNLRSKIVSLAEDILISTADTARLYHHISHALTNGIRLLQSDDGGAGSTTVAPKAGDVPIATVEDIQVARTKRIDRPNYSGCHLKSPIFQQNAARKLENHSENVQRVAANRYLLGPRNLSLPTARVHPEQDSSKPPEQQLTVRIVYRSSVSYVIKVSLERLVYVKQARNLDVSVTLTLDITARQSAHCVFISYGPPCLQGSLQGQCRSVSVALATPYMGKERRRYVGLDLSISSIDNYLRQGTNQPPKREAGPKDQSNSYRHARHKTLPPTTTMTSPITHIVLFKYRPEITWSAFEAHFEIFQSLQTKCLHPDTGKPYMLSMRMGKNRSWEPFSKGMTHAFVLEFANQGDLDYYLLHDPVHREFSRNAGPLIEDSLVVDIRDGVLFGPKAKRPLGSGEYRGSCHCGGLEWTAKLGVAEHVLCHCQTCQKLGGGAYSCNQIIPRGDLSVTKGEPACYTYTGASANADLLVTRQESTMLFLSNLHVPCVPSSGSNAGEGNSADSTFGRRKRYASDRGDLPRRQASMGERFEREHAEWSLRKLRMLLKVQCSFGGNTLEFSVFSHINPDGLAQVQQHCGAFLHAQRNLAVAYFERIRIVSNALYFCALAPRCPLAAGVSHAVTAGMSALRASQNIHIYLLNPFRQSDRKLHRRSSVAIASVPNIKVDDRKSHWLIIDESGVCDNILNTRVEQRSLRLTSIVTYEVSYKGHGVEITVDPSREVAAVNWKPHIITRMHDLPQCVSWPGNRPAITPSPAWPDDVGDTRMVFAQVVNKLAQKIFILSAIGLVIMGSYLLDVVVDVYAEIEVSLHVENVACGKDVVAKMSRGGLFDGLDVHGVVAGVRLVRHSTLIVRRAKIVDRIQIWLIAGFKGLDTIESDTIGSRLCPEHRFGNICVCHRKLNNPDGLRDDIRQVPIRWPNARATDILSADVPPGRMIGFPPIRCQRRLFESEANEVRVNRWTGIAGRGGRHHYL
ncbi:hypothetical protein KC342_g123 [Hortaea werneckii]|nr:hypothetical protein KC342_g123 [Hortaea werneckii]